MLRIRDVLGLWTVLLVALGGCALTEKEVKPPHPPEEFRAPPENDPRYSKPIEYPKETMDQDGLMKKAKDPSKNTPGPLNRPGTPGRNY